MWQHYTNLLNIFSLLLLLQSTYVNIFTVYRYDLLFFKKNNTKNNEGEIGFQQAFLSNKVDAFWLISSDSYYCLLFLVIVLKGILLHERTYFFSADYSPFFPTTQGNNLYRGILALARLLKIINYNQLKIYENKILMQTLMSWSLVSWSWK